MPPAVGSSTAISANCSPGSNARKAKWLGALPSSGGGVKMNAVGVMVVTLRAVSADEWLRMAKPGLPPTPLPAVGIGELQVEQRQQIAEPLRRRHRAARGRVLAEDLG